MGPASQCHDISQSRGKMRSKTHHLWTCGLLKHVSVFCEGVSVYVWEALVDHPPHCVG